MGGLASTGQSSLSRKPRAQMRLRGIWSISTSGLSVIIHNKHKFNALFIHKFNALFIHKFNALFIHKFNALFIHKFSL